MFEVGSYVSYRSEGVCVIVDIRTEAFNALGKSEEFYILAPIKDMNSVLYVPLGNAQLTSKMLPLLSADEICELAGELREARMEWINDSRARNSVLRDMLSSGGRRDLVILVNTIVDRIERADEIGRNITAGDANILARAKKMLLDEFSVTSDIDSVDALMAVLSGERRCLPRGISLKK